MTGRPAGVLLISLPATERSEGDPEDNKALLTREKGDFTRLNTSFICPHFLVSTCIGTKQVLVSFHPTLLACII